MKLAYRDFIRGIDSTVDLHLQIGQSLGIEKSESYLLIYNSATGIAGEDGWDLIDAIEDKWNPKADPQKQVFDGSLTASFRRIMTLGRQLGVNLEDCNAILERRINERWSEDCPESISPLTDDKALAMDAVPG